MIPVQLMTTYSSLLPSTSAFGVDPSDTVLHFVLLAVVVGICEAGCCFMILPKP